MSDWAQSLCDRHDRDGWPSHVMIWDISSSDASYVCQRLHDIPHVNEISWRVKDGDGRDLACLINNNSAIQTLSVVDGFGHHHAAVFEALRYSRTITRLKLDRASIYPDVYDTIRHNRSITALDLTCAVFDVDVSNRIVQAVCDNPTITSLTLWECVVPSVTPLLARSHLNYLCLEHAKDTQVDASFRDALAKNTTLQHLDMRGCGLSEAQVDLIMQAMHTNKTLVSLDLTWVHVDDAVLAAMLEVNTTLRSVGASFSSCPTHLWKTLRRNTTLKSLAVRAWGSACVTEFSDDHFYDMLRVNTTLFEVDMDSYVSRLEHNYTLVNGSYGEHDILHENEFLKGISDTLPETSRVMTFLEKSGILSVNDVFRIWPLEFSPLATIWQYLFGDACNTPLFTKYVHERCLKRTLDA